MTQHAIYNLCLLLLLSQVALSQKIEVVRLNHEQMKTGPYLRFDQTTIDDETYKNAKAKQVLLHDKQGYLWLRSSFQEPDEALIRYDGNSTKVFKGANWTIHEAKDGTIFGANTTKGIVVYDPRSEVFRQYRNPFVKYKDPKLEFTFTDLNTMGNQHDLWFVQQHDENSYKQPLPIFRFDYTKLLFTRFLPKYVKNGYDGQLESFKEFSPLITTPNGLVWGMVLTKQHPHSLGYFDPHTRHCVSFRLDITAPDADPNSDTFSFLKNVVFDGRYLWLGHAWIQLGLLRFDTQTHQWKQFLFNEPNRNRINGIDIKNSDELWLRTGQGFCVFNKNTVQIAAYQHELSNPFSYPNHSTSFYPKSNGLLWFGKEDDANDNTANFLDTTRQYFKQNTLRPPNGTGFRSLLKKGNKHIYVYHLDNITIIVEHSETTNTNKELWRYIDKKGLFVDIGSALDDSINNKIWLFGGNIDIGNLLELDKKKGKVVPVKVQIKNEKGKTEQINGIGSYCQDQSGDVWFAHVGRVIRFNHVTKAFEGFKLNVVDEIEEIRSMMTDSRGMIWIGYRSGMLVWFDPKNKKQHCKKCLSAIPMAV